MKSLAAFLEAHTVSVLKPEGKDWDVVIIQPGLSLNGFFYAPDVLREAAPLFEGSKVCAYRLGKQLDEKFEHPDERAMIEKPSGFAENVVGFLKNARYGKFKTREGETGEGILARFHVLEGHDWLRKNLRDAWEQGLPELLGFSINAEGEAEDAFIQGQKAKKVGKIKEVTSTEVVTEPAAGGALLRLVASKGGVEVKDVYELIRENRPMWLEGFSEVTDDTDMPSHVESILEAALVQAEDVQRAIPIEHTQRLAEVARGVNTLNNIITLLKDGKIEEAMGIMRNWVANYPVPEQKNDNARQQESFSFPYIKPQTGNPPVELATSLSESVTEKETEMDAEMEAKLKKLEELEAKEAERDAESEKREKELALRERNLRVQERVGKSELPESARTRVVELLAVREGELSDEAIDEAIKAEREYISTLRESDSETTEITDLGDAHGDDKSKVRVQVTKEKRDRWGKAMEGMFAGGLDYVDNVRPFRSLREAFGEIAGHNLKGYVDNETMAEYIFAGIRMAFPHKSKINCMEKHLTKIREGWNPYNTSDTVHLKEAIVTTDFPILFGATLNLRLQKEFAAPELNDWRKIVSSVENLNDITNDFNLPRMGYIGVMPDVNEGAAYQEVATDPTEKNEVLKPKKKGHLLKLTLEDILADRVGVIRAIPRRLGRSGARTVQQLVWDQIEDNPLLDADSVALINATHNNILVGGAALNNDNLVTLIKQLRNQTEQDSLEKLGLNPAFLLVSPTKEAKAFELTGSTVKANTTEDSTVANFIRKAGLEAFPTIGLGRTSSTEFRYYVAASPKDAETIVLGALGGRVEPDIFVQSPMDTPTAGASFDADVLTFKSRMGIGAKVADFRWIQGSLATA